MNFSAAHCYGVPQILSEVDTLAVLSKIVARFEQHVDKPMMLDVEWARPVARAPFDFAYPSLDFAYPSLDSFAKSK